VLQYGIRFQRNLLRERHNKTGYKNISASSGHSASNEFLMVAPAGCPSRVKSDKVDRTDLSRHVRFAPKADKRADGSLSPLCAISRHMQCSKQHRYSITSSARVTSVSGSVIPSAFAVFKLMTNSNFVGCCTGRSAGFSPLRIRPA
jgi:hypothetical protein